MKKNTLSFLARSKPAHPDSSHRERPELKRRPLNFSSLYFAAFGLGIIAGSGPAISSASGDKLLSALFRFVNIGAAAIAVGLLSMTVLLQWLDHRRFAQLHRYMTEQARAGATVEVAIDRTRLRMEMEIEQAGSYFNWLVCRRM